MSPKHKKSLHLEKPKNHLLTQSDMINPTRCLRYLTFCLTLTAGFLSVSTLLAQAPGLKLSVVSVPTATVYRLPQSGPSEAAQAAGAAYLYQIFRRSDGTGWVQWFQGQTGLTTTWHFNSAQFDPMPVGGPFGGIVTVSQPASLPVPPPPTDPLSGVENPNPTDPVWPLLYCFLANAEANAVAPPATSPLSAADAVLRDLLVAHQNAIRTAIQTPPPPVEEEPIQLYDSLGQWKADFFRFKLATVPPDTDHDGMPNDLESQTSYGVVINEAVYANSSGFTDEQGFVVDWIELRNLTAVPVSLAGWGFTTSSSLPGMVIFDSTVVVPASGYLLVLASGRGTNPAKVTGSSVAEVHLPFTLPDSGGYLGLFKPASPGSAPSVLVHRWNNERSPSVPATGQNVSWGITYNDLGQITWAYFGEPTPGAENAPGGYNGISLPPSVLGGQVGQVLPDGGSVTVGFGPPSTGAAIYYTVNGSWPTTLSDRYTSPLTISRTTVVRAIAVEAGKLPSRSITRSFISRLDTLAQQRPEGIISSSTVLAAGGVLIPEGFVPLLDEHRQALYPIVSADVARWLAEPNASGNPTLADYGPKRWLSETNQLRQTGAGSWFLNNRTNYLQSLTSSGHFTP